MMYVICPCCGHDFQVEKSTRLTAGELRVVCAFVQGGYPAVDDAGIAHSTAKNYMSRVYKKLGVRPEELLKYWNCELFQRGIAA